ncbi:minor capsid protein [Bacillus paranthracis]|uniref:minor capsid protein n=1 Tax=Bacillus cereus group TaxID=86661 RepID=UPI002DBABBCE|nr:MULTISPECIES: minor capsid protein [Bacillus cereus group]MEB9869088.1 minor capsid protein [Bacillus cereus]MED3346950.1 minor capsid protein [Bacillus thuringiensis]MED1372562.1 minor capsid protein [Bacillus paranthracis]MED1431127.1 minor capsid protein [Bacillus mycoides]MED1436946.1 minor capsid protein [Bacillus mycoides]
MVTKKQQWLIDETERVARELHDNIEDYLHVLDKRYQDILGSLLADLSRVLNRSDPDAFKQARLQELIYQTQARITSLGGEVADELKDKLQKISSESKLAHDAIMEKIAPKDLKTFVGLPVGAIDIATMFAYKDYAFETSINKAILKTGEKLNDIIVEGISKGWGITQYTKEIQEAMDSQAYYAKRIARTETSRVYNEAASQSYRDYGVTKVEWLATLEKRTCARCAALHGKKFKMNDVPPIPLHPHCRCTTVPVEINGVKL